MTPPPFTYTQRAAMTPPLYLYPEGCNDPPPFTYTQRAAMTPPPLPIPRGLQ